MKKRLFIAWALLLCGGSAMAQEETPAHFKLYGFIRNYTVADSRAVKAGTEDLYFYMPQDVNMTDGFDANDGFNWRYVSLTTRLGLDVSGYKWGKMGISGKVEADFYCLNGSVPTLRLRQAFMKLNWDDSPLTLTLGQAWHPMAVDMPHITNLETGAPFNPFNRSPQATLDVNMGGGFSFTASLLYLNHYLPTGPGNTKSKDYYKYGLPEVYAGFTYKGGKVLAKVGVDIVNMRPYRTHTDVRVMDDAPTVEVKSLLTTLSPFVFFQFTNGKFQLRAKSILAQAGEHMNLLSGYGVAGYNLNTNPATSPLEIEYTPMQDWASFVSFSYGKKFQVLGMLGYMKQLGTTKDLAGDLWINTAADTKIQQAFRATPTVAWNLGKFTVSLEYNLTAAEFGRGTRNARGMFTGTPEWVLNHRFICMTKFNF